MRAPRLLRPASLLIAGSLLLSAVPNHAPAATGGFSATLALEQRTASGIESLSAAQRTFLDQLIADEVAFTRREKLTELEGTFASRRTDAQRREAGLDQLTPDQLAKLNTLVAGVIAGRPQPKERPRLRDGDVISAKSKPQIHGSVTAAYGWGKGGRDFRAGSMFVNYYDPNSRIGIGIGISQSEGDLFPGYGYPGCYYDPLYDPLAPIFYDAAFTDGFFPGDDYYFPGPYTRGFPRRGFIRR